MARLSATAGRALVVLLALALGYILYDLYRHHWTAPSEPDVVDVVGRKRTGL